MLRRSLGLAVCVFLTTGVDAQASYEFRLSKHLRLFWSDDSLGQEDVGAIGALGDRYVEQIAELLDESVDDRVIVFLEGPAERADGSWGTPHVDGAGRVRLYRYGPTYHDYLGAFAHELVHALRHRHTPHHDWFFEEGLAEFVALRLDEPLRGFPWYEVPVVVAAGQWVASGQDIALSLLREQHRATNLPCKAQSYTLRSSFFDYLGKTFGDESVVKMTRLDRPGALDDYQAVFGDSFENLAAAWRRELLKEYASTEGVRELSVRYRNETPIQYMPVCDSSGNVHGVEEE